MRTTSTAILAAGMAIFLIASAMESAENGRRSDIVRRWIVGQYINAGQDPWDLCKEVLAAKYGEGNPNQTRIYNIPQEIPAYRAKDVFPALGPPEATYPPPAAGLLASTIGLLSTPEIVLWFWFAVNIALLGWVAVELTRLWPVPPGGGARFDNFRLVLAGLILFPATRYTFGSGQFTLLVLGLLLAANDPSRGWLTRGAALGVALIKPSIALPFVFLPLVNRQWRVLSAAAAVQAFGTTYVMLRTGSVDVIDMISDWLAVSGYFLNGMYTLQEWVNVLNPLLPSLDPKAASLGVLAFCGVILAAARHFSFRQQFTIAAATSVFWTYHLNYDFVMLLPALMPLAGWSDRRSGRGWSAVGPAVFVIVGLALLYPIYIGQDPFTRVIRWMARIGIIGTLAWEYARVFRSVKSTGLDSEEHVRLPRRQVDQGPTVRKRLLAPLGRDPQDEPAAFSDQDPASKLRPKEAVNVIRCMKGQREWRSAADQSE